MQRYISWKDIWFILEGVEFEEEDPLVAMIELIFLLKSAGGRFINMGGSSILFLKNYDYLDYKYSSSIIASDDIKLQIEKKEVFVNKILEEQDCIQWLVSKINDSFDDFPNIYLNVFYDRYFLNQNVTFLKDKYSVNNKKYYKIIQTSEYLVQKRLLLIKPKFIT